MPPVMEEEVEKKHSTVSSGKENRKSKVRLLLKCYPNSLICLVPFYRVVYLEHDMVDPVDQT